MGAETELNPVISIIIPNREDENPYLALKSLSGQIGDSEIIIVYDEGKGANWARNRGVELAKGDYFLFSDNDVIWEPTAIQDLFDAIDPPSWEIGYSYGWYEIDGFVQCQQNFSQSLLMEMNYISTMSLVHRDIFPGFDESIQRLQDWDLWLTLLEKGIMGVYCGQKIFTTTKRDGITFGNGVNWEEARKIVMEKHHL